MKELSDWSFRMAVWCAQQHPMWVSVQSQIGQACTEKPLTAAGILCESGRSRTKDLPIRDRHRSATQLHKPRAACSHAECDTMPRDVQLLHCGMADCEIGDRIRLASAMFELRTTLNGGPFLDFKGIPFLISTFSEACMWPRWT